MIKETTPSQRALDHASHVAGYEWIIGFTETSPFAMSIMAHARTLDQLWERCPDLAPKTKGERFADELLRRRWPTSKNTPSVFELVAQMIDENWEPKDDASL